jgi:hypothetical protein
MKHQKINKFHQIYVGMAINFLYPTLFVEISIFLSATYKERENKKE